MRNACAIAFAALLFVGLFVAFSDRTSEHQKEVVMELVKFSMAALTGASTMQLLRGNK